MTKKPIEKKRQKKEISQKKFKAKVKALMSVPDKEGEGQEVIFGIRAF